MGISIKNHELEEMLRAYASARGLSLTKAVEQALRLALDGGGTTSANDSAIWTGFLDAARQSTLSSDGKWSREDAHER